jgi:hypothetical protein
MAAYVMSQTYVISRRRTVSVRREAWIPWLKRHSARLAMLVALLGIGIPFLMMFNLVPSTLSLFFVGLILAGAGGMVALIRCGDIC